MPGTVAEEGGIVTFLEPGVHERLNLVAVLDHDHVRLRDGQDNQALPGPWSRTSSTCRKAVRSRDSQESAFSPVSRTHHASASLRLRATPASTSVSRTRRSGWRSLVITGTESVVNISVTSAQVTPHDTLRRNLCSASRAISIRRLLVSSRNLRIRPSAAAARSASDAPPVSGAGSPPTIVI